VLVDRFESLDAIMEAAVEQPERRILVDLAAQTNDPLLKWIDESGVLNLADEMGVAITYWHVMDSGKDSVDLLKKLLDRFGKDLRYVVVRNQVRGSNFSVLEQSGEQAARGRLGADGDLGAPPARRRHQQDRRHQQQLLVGAARRAGRRRGLGPDGAPARQDVAARCLSARSTRWAFQGPPTLWEVSCDPAKAARPQGRKAQAVAVPTASISCNAAGEPALLGHPKAGARSS
jgi:hypothetical protein